MSLLNKGGKDEPMCWCPGCGTALVFGEHDRERGQAEGLLVRVGRP